MQAGAHAKEETGGGLDVAFAEQPVDFRVVLLLSQTLNVGEPPDEFRLAPHARCRLQPLASPVRFIAALRGRALIHESASSIASCVQRR